MLKFQNWYTGIWIAILTLYSFGWSALNIQLKPSLLVFFIISAVVSMGFGLISRPIPLLKIHWLRERKPIITALIVVGFVADWAYQQKIPVFHPYSGFDTSADKQAVVGIPVAHVVLIAVTIFYAMYLVYLFLSDTKHKGYLCEYAAMLVLLMLNNSRGYVVYTVFLGILLYVAFNKKRLFSTNVIVYCLAVLGAVGIIFFISVAGNIRSGYSWNDCSYIETIGYYRGYPEWLTKHIMWFYTYATSPLSNLNLNCSLFIGNYNVGGLLTSFFPEQVGNFLHLNSDKPAYVVQHLNACTGFVSFVTSAGVLGLVLAFIGIVGLYSALKLILKRYVVLQTFGNATLCFLTISMIFFNCFNTSALCYIPLFLIVSSICLNRKLINGDIALVEQ